MMKKILSLMLALLLMLGLFGCAANSEQAPNNTTGNNELELPLDTQGTTAPEATEHTHSYTETVTKEATCSEKGEKTLKCACGDTKIEELAKLDHTYTKATCLAPKTCTVCGKTSGNKGSHNYKNGECTVCGKEENKKLTAGDWLCYDGPREDMLTVIALDFKDKKITMTGYISAGKFGEKDIEYEGEWWSKVASGNMTATITEKKESGSTVTVKAKLDGEAITLTLKRSGTSRLVVDKFTGTIPGYDSEQIVGAIFTFEA